MACFLCKFTNVNLCIFCNLRSNREALSILNLLTTYHKKQIVEFLSYHECDGQSRQAPDLDCLVKLQAQNIRQRHVIFLTGALLFTWASPFSNSHCRKIFYVVWLFSRELEKTLTGLSNFSPFYSIATFQMIVDDTPTKICNTEILCERLFRKRGCVLIWNFRQKISVWSCINVGAHCSAEYKCICSQWLKNERH